MTGTVPLAIHVPTSTPTASRIKMATIINETVSLMPCCSSAYGMPKPHDDNGDADEQHQPCLPGLYDSFFFHDCRPFSFWLGQIEKG